MFFVGLSNSWISTTVLMSTPKTKGLRHDPGVIQQAGAVSAGALLLGITCGVLVSSAIGTTGSCYGDGG